MTELALNGCHILIVEDEYLLAQDLRAELADAGAVVAGMAGTVAGALEQIESLARLDGAILDVNLRGESVFPVADRLAARGVPFLFTTGYDASALPPRFRHVVRCEKPMNMASVVRAIGKVVAACRP